MTRDTTILAALSVEEPQRPNLTTHVADRLGRLIVESKLEPGELLPSEDALGEAFGVSKRVIREALRTLAAQGIVKTSQGRRAMVAHSGAVAIEAYFRYASQLDRTAALELYELREVIEVRATALAAKRRSSADLDRARQALEAMEEAGDDLERYIEGDLEFHRAVIEAAHNRFLSAIMDALGSTLREERRIGVENRARAGDEPRAIKEHRAILDALRAGSTDEAERAILAHLASGLIDFRPERFHRSRSQPPAAAAQSQTRRRSAGKRAK